MRFFTLIVVRGIGSWSSWWCAIGGVPATLRLVFVHLVPPRFHFGFEALTEQVVDHFLELGGLKIRMNKSHALLNELFAPGVKVN